MNLENLKKLDYDLSYKIAKSIDTNSPVRKIFQISTVTGTAFFWFIITPIWYYLFNGDQEAITFGFITLVMLLPVFIMKQTIRRNRPDFKDTRFGAVIFDEFSFPSGHATRSTYVVILMSFYMKELLIFWILWALLMISSRLILGVHYVSDILGGIVLSLFCLLIMYLFGWIPLIPWDLSRYLP